MKVYMFVFIFVLSLSSIAFAQDSDKIMEEGRLLYRIEKSSWYGTDDFIARFPHKLERVGGYFSYVDEENELVNVFYSKENPFQILVRYKFESVPRSKPVSIDSTNQTATRLEKDLITLRTDAAKKMAENEDSFFSFYRNTSSNLIPIITESERKVIILTAPRIQNVLILGNDYLLRYDDNNQLIKKEKLHESILQFPLQSKNTENKPLGTVHTHVTDDYITSTDVSTLLLYKDFIEWKQHVVMSKNFVSSFNLPDETLEIMSKKEWDAINKKMN